MTSDLGMPVDEWIVYWLKGKRSLLELRLEYGRLQTHGRVWPSWSLLYPLFCKMSDRATLEGMPLDALSQYSPHEGVRFEARVVPGPDGHRYWIGGKEFQLNSEGSRRTVSPQRWAWANAFGEVGRWNVIRPTCGEENCVEVSHLRLVTRSEYRTVFSVDEIINRLKVLAMQLGRTPTVSDWVERGCRPDREIIRMRFGSWVTLCKRAGLPPPIYEGRFHPPAGPEECIQALKELRNYLGREPREGDIRKNWVFLKERGLIATPKTIRKHLGGSWPEALKRLKEG